MKRLPIKSASDVAKAYGLSQVILAAWDGERTHIVTYGKNTEDCAQAAMGGNKIKDALGWPRELHAEPSRVTKMNELLARCLITLSRIEPEWTKASADDVFGAFLIDEIDPLISALEAHKKRP